MISKPLHSDEMVWILINLFLDLDHFCLSFTLTFSFFSFKLFTIYVLIYLDLAFDLILGVMVVLLKGTIEEV